MLQHSPQIHSLFETTEHSPNIAEALLHITQHVTNLHLVFLVDLISILFDCICSDWLNQTCVLTSSCIRIFTFLCLKRTRFVTYNVLLFNHSLLFQSLKQLRNTACPTLRKDKSKHVSKQKRFCGSMSILDVWLVHSIRIASFVFSSIN